MTNRLSEILVVSDIDGTLLQSGFGIPKDNIDAIERFTALGGKFTLASGRGITMTAKYTEFLNLNAPAILANGGIIYDFSSKKILYEKTLDADVRIILNEIMNDFPEMGVEIQLRENLVAFRMNNEIHNHTATERIPVTLTDMNTIGDGWNKVLFADNHERIHTLKTYIERKRKRDTRYKKYEFVQSSDIYFELIPMNINKGTGLKKLSEIMGIEIENTVAIGDFYNDIEILTAAGLAVVVADAPDDVKKRADIIVKSCLAGGVAELLNMLIEKGLSE